MSSSSAPNEAELNDEEVTRIAMRITMSTFSDIQENASSDADIVREYIKLCPYVSADSPAIRAALQGLSKESDINLPSLQPDSGNSSPRSWPTEQATTEQATTETNGKQSIKFERIRSIQKGDLKPKKKTTFGKLLTVFGYLLRTLLLDAPLFLLFGLYLFAVWTHHVHDNYLLPEIDAMSSWDDSRQEAEETYYKRYCTAKDMSTNLGSDLFLPIESSSKEAMDHHLIHGATVFQSVLSEKTSSDLREFVISQNFNLPEEESIFVIANKKRYSFGLGTEEPTVATAMKELAAHERLKPALERILGPNPALIEMTAITSTYGAKAQYWHDDVIARASAMQFGRSFGPSYSVFVQLQNTTKSLGATDVCPGTHFCASGPIEAFCDQNGFQVVGEDGMWKTGDAMLMNMNLYHRGAAHTEKGGEDRVMLILTFVPKPQTRAESRMMSQGITFSLRWDMWGHTLDDLVDADTRMAQPWATLRALGLYKRHEEAQWGIDYITGSMMRIAAGDSGFREEQLEEWIDGGGFKVLPKFLEGQVDLEEESWMAYYKDTLVRCEKFLQQVNIGALAAYLLFQIIFLTVSMAMPSNTDKKSVMKRFGWALVRLAMTHAICYALYLAAIRHVDNSMWARDIRADRRYTNPFVLTDNEFTGPTTYPHREDVLIETRYKSAHLASYNNFVMTHTGNRHWKPLLESTAPLYADYQGLPRIFRHQLTVHVVTSMEHESRRFLYQGKESHWHVMSRPDALRYNDKQLKISSNHVVRFVYTRIEYLLSECKHGFLRSTAMVRYDTLPFLRGIQDKILEYLKEQEEELPPLARFPDDSKDMNPKARNITVIHRSFTLAPVPPSGKAKFVRRPVNLKVGANTPTPPSPGAWRTEGDIIEARYKDGNIIKWYYGTLGHTTSMGWHSVTFYDGHDAFVKPDAVRPYKPFERGESVEVWHQDKFQKAKILDYGENHVHAEIIKTGQVLNGLFKGNVRRPNKKPIAKKRNTDNKYVK